MEKASVDNTLAGCPGRKKRVREGKEGGHGADRSRLPETRNVANCTGHTFFQIQFLTGFLAFHSPSSTKWLKNLNCFSFTFRVKSKFLSLEYKTFGYPITTAKSMKFQTCCCQALCLCMSGFVFWKASLLFLPCLLSELRMILLDFTEAVFLPGHPP